MFTSWKDSARISLFYGQFGYNKYMTKFYLRKPRIRRKMTLIEKDFEQVRKEVRRF